MQGNHTAFEPTSKAKFELPLKIRQLININIYTERLICFIPSGWVAPTLNADVRVTNGEALESNLRGKPNNFQEAYCSSSFAVSLDLDYIHPF